MRNSPARGFTLIEVLVAVAVIAILTGLGLASYRRFDSTRKVEAAAVGFGTFLRTSQKKVDAGERPSWCDPAMVLEGYFVYVASQHTASEYPICASIPNELEYTLLYGAEFDNLAFAVKFLPIGKGTVYDPVTSSNTTDINLDGTSTAYSVMVESGGAITVEKI